MIETMEAIDGDEGVESAKALTDAAFEVNPDLEYIRGAIIKMREALAECPTSADFGHDASWRDLDAAICWLGARLDDLLIEIG